jgi:hypothetical protein
MACQAGENTLAKVFTALAEGQDPSSVKDSTGSDVFLEAPSATVIYFIGMADKEAKKLATS